MTKDDDYTIIALFKAFLSTIALPPPLESIQPNFDDVQQGDHLVYMTQFGVNIHFYVDAILKNGKIEVYGWFCEDTDNPFIEHEKFFSRSSVTHLKIKKRILDAAALKQPTAPVGCMKRQVHKVNNIAEEKKRIKECQDEGRLYGFIDNNSEHFVNYVKTGNKVAETYAELAIPIIWEVSKEVLTKASALKLFLTAVSEHFDIKLDLNLILEILSTIRGGQASEATARAVPLESVNTQQTKPTTAKPNVTGGLKGAVGAAKSAIKANAKKLLVVQLIVDGTIWGVQIGSAYNNYRNGHMGPEEFKDCCIERSTATVGRIVGGYGGSLTGVGAGAAIGTLVCPGIGTFIGSALGGFLGGCGGNAIGNKCGSSIGNYINQSRK